MGAPCYIAYSGITSALTAPLAAIASSAVANTPKTLLQIKPATPKIRILEWGYHFTTAPAAPVSMELIETGTVFATVTQGNVANYNDVTGPASQVALGTAATGYNATAEGTITASRLLAATLDLATVFKQQFPLGREPEVNGGAALRVRIAPTTAAAVSAVAYVVWEE